jgi:hypothetical protein
VETDSRDGDGAAGLVITRIADVLKVVGGKETAPKVSGVETLEDFFMTVGEAAVAEQEADSAESKILLMRGHDPIAYESNPGAIVAPAP